MRVSMLFKLMLIMVCLWLLLGVLPACSDGAADAPPDGDGDVEAESEPGDGDADVADGDVGDGDVSPDGDKPDGDEDAEIQPDGDADDSADGDVDEAVDGDLDDEAAEPIELTKIKVMENPANVLSYFVSWKTDIEATTDLEIRCGEDFEQRYRSKVRTTDHEVFIMGLYDGARCSIDIQATAGSREGSAQATIESVGPIPDELPALTVTEYDPEKVRPGWTFASFSRINDSFPDMAVGFDHLGRYRWYHFTGINQSNGDHEIFLYEDGLMVGGAEPQYYVNWEGLELWNLDVYAHHDMRLSPFNDNHVLFITDAKQNCDTTEHSVNELNMETGEVVWTWRICDHVIPRYQKWNWSHLNTTEPFPGERAVLVSSRDQDYIFRLNRDTDEIEWVLGKRGDFEMDPYAYFLRQHAPEILPNGHILLFDNGLSTWEAQHEEYSEMIREYSRVLEFELSFKPDGSPDRADLVWEYVDRNLFAINRSEADRLDNGNTLIVYVRVPPDYRVTVREVTAEKEIVWNVISPPDYHSYRVERMEPYFGHVND